MHIFGWCSDGFHEDYEGEYSAPCKGSYRLVLKDTRKQGRKTVEVTLKDVERTCECPCHSGKKGMGRMGGTKTKRRRK